MSDPPFSWYILLLSPLWPPPLPSNRQRPFLLLFTAAMEHGDKAKNNEVEARLYIILLSNKIFFNNFNNIPVAVTMYFCFVISPSFRGSLSMQLSELHRQTDTHRLRKYKYHTTAQLHKH